jgi:hypothetical protein
MMTLGKLLENHKDAIVQRWLDELLDAYGGDSGAAFRREKDPFANPVGHSLRIGTLGIFESLLGRKDDEQVRQLLRDIIKIRAVQQFSPSRAISFLFRLKDVIREELREAVGNPQLASEWAELDGRIDRVALAAFDIFVECREQVYDLRVSELKRSVSWVVERMNRDNDDSDVDPDRSAMKAIENVNGQREGPP